jgi:hypothetical protein
MVRTYEQNLRWWAISAAMIVVILSVLPTRAFRALIFALEAPTVINYVAKKLLAGIVLVVVLGFYLRMVFECGFARNIYHRGAWLTLLIIVPLVSAFIYYWVTRSAYYKNRAYRLTS